MESVAELAQYADLLNVALVPILIYIKRICKEMDEVKGDVKELRALHLVPTPPPGIHERRRQA